MNKDTINSFTKEWWRTKTTYSFDKGEELTYDSIKEFIGLFPGDWWKWVDDNIDGETIIITRDIEFALTQREKND